MIIQNHDVCQETPITPIFFNGNKFYGRKNKIMKKNDENYRSKFLVIALNKNWMAGTLTVGLRSRF
jgi:hypothetical protein